MARIKRGLRLKKKIALQNNLQLSSDDGGKSRAKSELAYGANSSGAMRIDGDLNDRADLESSGLANVSIVDPRSVQIENTKRINQLRAK